MFSLLLPVYAGDRPEFLRRAVGSAVDAQTLRPDEVVIVQDGPIPQALASELDALIAASPVPVRLEVRPVNAGLADALEAGLAACSHDVVARMDADDVCAPERFARMVPLVDGGGYDLVGSGMWEFVDDPAVSIGTRVPPTGSAAIAEYARFHDPFNHPTVVYRRSAVAAAGGYRAVGLMEDYWLFARMIASGARVENLPDPLVGYRVGAGAYKRRGGLGQLRAELALQTLMRRTGFTTRRQWARNVVVRGGYRLVPQAIRQLAYRRYIAPAPRG